MNTVYTLSSSYEIDGTFDFFALDDDDLRQLALDNYDVRSTAPVHVEVRPPDAPHKVRISEGGLVMAEYHITKIYRVIR
jgi:hypothetical protein